MQAAQEGPRAVATAVGEHQAERQEEQHAQEQLLVGQRDEVPAFLVEIGEGGDAQEGPHGAEGQGGTWPAGSPFLLEGTAGEGKRLGASLPPKKKKKVQPKRGAPRLGGRWGRGVSKSRKHNARRTVRDGGPRF